MDIIHALDEEKIQQIPSMPLCSLSSSSLNSARKSTSSQSVVISVWCDE